MKNILILLILTLLFVSCGDEVEDKASFIEEFSKQHCEHIFECSDDGRGYSNLDECKKATAKLPTFNDDFCHEFDLELANEYLSCSKKLTCSEFDDYDKCSQKYEYKYCKDKEGKKEVSYKIATAACKKEIKCGSSKTLEECSYRKARRIYSKIRKYIDPNTDKEINCTLDHNYIDENINCNQKLECNLECHVYNEKVCKFK